VSNAEPTGARQGQVSPRPLVYTMCYIVIAGLSSGIRILLACTVDMNVTAGFMDMEAGSQALSLTYTVIEKL
jgi:hypothetical protein